MNKYIKFLLGLFSVFVILKSILVLLVPAPSIFGDEYIYAKLASSIFNLHEYSVHGISQPSYPPFYPLVLAMAYFSKNMNFVYPLMKIINVILSSLIIFPAFYLTKEFVTDKNAILISTLISVLPASFVFPAYILSENLFYPLFLTTLFFICRAFKENKFKWHAISAILIGLCILTRYIGFVLLILFVALATWKFIKKDWASLKNYILIAGIMLFSIACAFAIRFMQFGIGTRSILGPYASIIKFSQFSVTAYVTWILLYIGIVALASGLIFFIAMIASKSTDKNLNVLKYITLILLFATILIVSKTAAANIIKAETLFPWLVGRPIARYIDIFLPLIMICGFCFYNEKTNTRLKLASLFLAGTFILSSQLVFFKLFPINNTSLLWLGLAKIGFDKVFGQNLIIISIIFCLILVFLLGISYMLFKLKINRRKITVLLITFFLLLSLANYSVIYYNSKTNWYDNEYSQLGLWLANNIEEESMVLIDVRDCAGLDARTSLCIVDNGVSLVSFWLTNIVIADPEQYNQHYDYVVSKHKLDLPAIKSDDSIFVYGAKNDESS